MDFGVILDTPSWCFMIGLLCFHSLGVLSVFWQGSSQYMIPTVKRTKNNGEVLLQACLFLCLSFQRSFSFVGQKQLGFPDCMSAPRKFLRSNI